VIPREVDFLRWLVAIRPAALRHQGLAARMAEQAGLGALCARARPPVEGAHPAGLLLNS